MKVSYDKEVDVMRVLFSDRAVVQSDEVSQGVIADYSADGSLVGLEILCASRTVDLSRILLEHMPLAA